MQERSHYTSFVILFTVAGHQLIILRPSVMAAESTEKKDKSEARCAVYRRRVCGFPESH